MWQISNLSEGASIFTNGFNIPTSGSDAAWTNQNNMSANGKYIYEKFASYAPTADWRNNPPPPVSSSSLDVSSSSSSLGNNQSSSSGGSQSSSSGGGNRSSSSDVSSPIAISKAASGPIRVSAIGNLIVLENLPGNAKAEVYNLRGALVYSANSENSQILQIPVQTKGLYIVRYGSSSGKAIKVLVK
jgi:hypothetical protein